MIGLDTNVLIRYLTQDDPSQSKKANDRVDGWLAAGEILWICHVTLIEMYWVLQRCYKLSKSELIRVITQLLQTKQIEVEGEEVAWQALRDYEKSLSVGFPDCLIGRQNAYCNCGTTYTFDKDAAKQLPWLFQSM